MRTKITSELSASVMFCSDRTCCVCHERGKTVQIHHIDEDPSNNSQENLAVLCLECHDATQIKGGFGRKLNGGLVIKYRDDWLNRVESRRNRADIMAVERKVNEENLSHCSSANSTIDRRCMELKDPPMDYINYLPEFKKALLLKAQPLWNTGVTTQMVQASYDYIDSLEGVLVILAEYYSKEQFKDILPKEYFSEVIASRFLWHRRIAEPEGPGTGGTIVNIRCSSAVVSDVEKMVEDLVMALVGDDDSFDWKGWPKRWYGDLKDVL